MLKNVLIGVARSPEEATVKDKMLFASSREALRQKLVGIAFEVQGTDPSEISYSAGSSYHQEMMAIS